MEATLEKVRQQSGNSLPHIQRPALLLQAIESTLAESSTQPSPTAYFASLHATSAAVLKNQDNEDGQQLLAAVLYLLAIVVPYTPTNVLISQHEALLQNLAAALAASTAEQANLKSLLTIMAHLYSVYSGKMLQRLDCTSLFNSVLPLLADSRPKLRKKAHETVKVVFEVEDHPYAPRTAEWINLALEAGYKDARKNEEAGGRLIGLLAFVSNVVTSWPKEHLPDLLTQLLTLPKINNPFLARSAFDVLESLFTRSAHNNLPVPSTFASLLALRPANNAIHTLPSWLAALEHAFVALQMVDPAACQQAFPASFKDALDLCGSQHPPEIRARAEKTVKAFIRWCLPVDNSALMAAIATGKGNLSLVIEALDDALGNLKYTGAGILHILNITTQLVQLLRVRPAGEDQTAAELFLDPHLTKVGAFRANPSFEYRDAAEHVIATMARVTGPEHVLYILPLNLFGEEQQQGPSATGRAWLLPLLKGNITNTSLGHFTSTFLPLSESLFNKAGESAGVEKKIYEALIDQIWALLPGYCDLPVDTQSAYTDTFAQVLGSVMYSQPTLRSAVFRALVVLIESNEKLAKSTAPPASNKEAFRLDQDEAQANLVYLGKKGVNLLSGMFNVYLKNSEGSGYMLDTVSAWMRVLDAKDLVAVHGKIVGMLNSALATEAKAKAKQKPNTTQTSHALLDLLVCLSSSSSTATATSLLQLAQSEQLIENQDSTVQKKAYRLLLRLTESAAGRSILMGKVDALLLELADKNVSGPAKKDRTELLSKLVDMLPNNQLHVIPPILSEAVLATKETNERTRQAGFDLIVEMGNKMRAGGTINRSLIPGMDDAMDEETPATLTEYFTMVAAGLTSTPHMISACITALSRLLFDFHTDLDRTMTDDLLSTITVFLKSKTREIVKSSLGFVKVCIAILPHSTIEAYLPQLVPNLLGWGTEHKNHFNLKVRHIFERLIRKFGFDTIAALVPEDDMKLVQNIRKKQLRAKRQKGPYQPGEEDAQPENDEEMAKPRAAAKSAYDEAVYGSESEMGDDDSEDDQLSGRTAPTHKGKQQQQHHKGGKKQRGHAYLTESGEMPMDLLDQDALDKVTVKNPRAGKKGKAPREEFKKDAAGRMVVNEEDDGEEQGGSTNAYLEAISGEDGFRRTSKGALRANKKRSRQEQDDDRWVDEVTGKLRLDEGAEPSHKKKKAAGASGSSKKPQIGSEFKAKKAGGDVKKGGVSPYAYVPLGQVAGKGKKGKTDFSIKGRK